jgi:hypothetical protein
MTRHQFFYYACLPGLLVFTLLVVAALILAYVNEHPAFVEPFLGQP